MPCNYIISLFGTVSSAIGGLGSLQHILEWKKKLWPKLSTEMKYGKDSGNDQDQKP